MNLETFEKLDKAKKEKILLVGIKEFARLSYREVSADIITRKCGISKGLLFHYFSSKKNYYLYCLQKALEVLMKRVDHQEFTSFYEILFSSMDAKFALYKQYPNQMRMVNMASMDQSKEIVVEKNALLKQYLLETQKNSQLTLANAIAALPLPDSKKGKITVTGLSIYVQAVVGMYLKQYQRNPDVFF